MKTIVALAVLLFAGSVLADTPPPVTARQALDLAEQNMKDRGIGNEVWIESVTLVHEAILHGDTYWFVKWSHPLVATDPAKRVKNANVRFPVDAFDQFA